MKIILDEKYFGGAEALERFVQETLEEIKVMDDEGRARSKRPDDFLGDVFPRLSAIKILFENFQKEVEKRKNTIEFNGMEESK